MNFERIFFWIRLVAEVILGILDRLEPGEGEESVGNPDDDFKPERIQVWLGILAMSIVLGIGLSWSFVRRALSGQYDVDDSDE